MKSKNSIILSALAVLLIFFLYISSATIVQAGIGPVEGCIVTINKVALPSDNTPFTFESNFNGEFILQDPSNNSTEYFMPLNAVEEVVEIVPEDWELVNVQCESMGVDGDFIESGVAFQCLTIGGSVECTFSNEGPEPVPDEVPTLSEWGLATVVALMFTAGIYAFYRRRKAAV